MDSTGSVTKIRDSTYGQFALFTFDTCTSAETCNTDNVPFWSSDPSGFLYDNTATYEGFHGEVPGEDVTVVFNIPVTKGTTLTILNNLISSGLPQCRTIFNIYPVDNAGYYDYDDAIEFARDFAGSLPGFTLAPQANIIDSANGNFLGQLIANSYKWSETSPGATINSYDECPQFQGCFPVKDYQGSRVPTVTVTQAVKTISGASGPTVYVMPYEQEDWHKKKKWGGHNDWDNKKGGYGDWDSKKGGYGDWQEDSEW
ncbi:hypothetical protein BDB00DRAFT_813173 [Zychaea mexicana]|uniref:uncharacterized protein n=1 Tax=Zychaea mexicana TaxID=64656 RepID=UPI0022FDF410|nr:uncharacterized protein BDB00DRAFT_813173 [Zychaea mexicana]KAI9495707.1 hypothetical protein BDB00DRAFT_813173 [Zychaea mexicana]